MAKPVKKRFFEVNAPLTHAKISLFANSEEELNGKHVKIDLTRSLKGKSYEYYLKVVLNGKQLEAIPKSLILTGSYVRRMMRTGVDYSEDSFIAETRDNKVQIKTFMITRNRVSYIAANNFAAVETNIELIGL
jgi:ribosomal protein S3AE